MEYEISNRLKKSIRKEIESKGAHNKKVIFGTIGKAIFPDLKSSALLIGEKLDLVSYDQSLK